jgi:hypothetical protein
MNAFSMLTQAGIICFCIFHSVRALKAGQDTKAIAITLLGILMTNFIQAVWTKDSHK